MLSRLALWYSLVKVRAAVYVVLSLILTKAEEWGVQKLCLYHPFCWTMQKAGERLFVLILNKPSHVLGPVFWTSRDQKWWKTIKQRHTIISQIFCLNVTKLTRHRSWCICKAQQWFPGDYSKRRTGRHLLLFQKMSHWHCSVFRDGPWNWKKTLAGTM